MKRTRLLVGIVFLAAVAIALAMKSCSQAPQPTQEARRILDDVSSPRRMTTAQPDGSIQLSEQFRRILTRRLADPSREADPLLHVTLSDSKGNISNPVFHLDRTSLAVSLEQPTRFRPGVYTLLLTVKDPLTGQQESFTQEFAWGVLAMNADQDHYDPGQTARLAFGVLDDEGKIVCNAALTLEVTSPDGGKRMLSTGDKSIGITGTCGRKQAGLILPDYEARIALPQEGVYQLTLSAATKNGTRSMTAAIRAVPADITVTRLAATRLWPFAPSPMTIDVQFDADMTGTVTDIVPPGFVITKTIPVATTQTLSDGSMLIRWKGSWKKGTKSEFHYLYDAPDVSPQFFLVGPLEIRSTDKSFQYTEQRRWQIANDDRLAGRRRRSRRLVYRRRLYLYWRRGAQLSSPYQCRRDAG